jgi:hypothetical protein
MGIGRLLVIMATLVLSFIGTIFLESKMEQYAVLELVIIVVGILLSIIALIGIAAESRWSWPFATILFSLLLANAVFLFVNVPAFVTFVLLIIVNIFGMLVSVLSINDSVPSVVSSAPAGEAPQVEPYVEEPAAEVTYKETKPKRGRRKKKR